MTVNELKFEEQLERLRKEWPSAPPSRRTIILIQVRALKIALEKTRKKLLNRQIPMIEKEPEKKISVG